MLRKSSKKGFTLAEVLVTLVVIGIVAALSIPALLQNTNQAELKTAFKKSLAVLNQALVMNVAQNSMDASSASSTNDLVNFFAGKLNVISSNTTAFTTADGMQYTFNQLSGKKCSNTETPDWGSANCTVMVDVNGAKSPNTLATGTGTTATYTDQYYMIIKANSVVPGNTTGNNAPIQALQN